MIRYGFIFRKKMNGFGQRKVSFHISFMVFMKSGFIMYWIKAPYFISGMEMTGWNGKGIPLVSLIPFGTKTGLFIIDN